jgi:uncharacterized protein
MNKDDVIARLKTLETRLREHGVAALYLFGSYARDEARPDSDLDLLADFAEGRDADIRGFLAPYHDLEEAFPGVDIGFSTRDRLVPLYRPSIESSAVRVF